MKQSDPIPPLKAHLARHITRRLDGWSQELAASFLQTDQPRMSDLRNNRLDVFSLDRLVRFIDRLGGDVTIGIVWARKNYIGPRNTST
jgi:predicted XRE-type DNA-binding protein